MLMLMQLLLPITGCEDARDAAWRRFELQSERRIWSHPGRQEAACCAFSRMICTDA
jgi:hypothetical protein